MPDQYVVVVGGGQYYYRPFASFGNYSSDIGLFTTPEKVALVVFSGGADISPSLYDHEPSRLSFCSPKRDVYEVMAFRRALKAGLPFAGICRGAQLLCAMAGGTLYQHVANHGSFGHSMRTIDGRIFHVSSTHHQMQRPPADATILAWSDEHRSDIYIGEDDIEEEKPEFEVECAYYPNIRAVGMQYHPEAMAEMSQGFRYAAELVRDYVM